MTPYYDHAGITIYHGDCREILPDVGGIELTVTSPPYGELRTYEIAAKRMAQEVFSFT